MDEKMNKLFEDLIGPTPEDLTQEQHIYAYIMGLQMRVTRQNKELEALLADGMTFEKGGVAMITALIETLESIGKGGSIKVEDLITFLEESSRRFSEKYNLGSKEGT